MNWDILSSDINTQVGQKKKYQYSTINSRWSVLIITTQNPWRYDQQVDTIIGRQKLKGVN